MSLGGVDALNHREMRRKARRERPLFSAIFCGEERRKYGYRYLLKKCHLSGKGVVHLRGGCARREEATFVWVEPERFIDSVRVSVVPRKAVVAPR